MAGRSLLHELGEDSGVERPVPLRRHRSKDFLSHRAAAPERDHFFSECLIRVIAHGKRSAQAPIEEAQVVLGVATQLGIGGGRLRRGATLADNQLIITDTD